MAENATTPLQISGVNGSVSFTGKMTGVLYLSLGDALARKAASAILGDDSGRPNEEVNDVIGELTNMVTGNLKSKMADKGFNCRLSIPTVIRGDNMTLDTADASLCLSSVFEVENSKELFSVQVFARLDE